MTKDHYLIHRRNALIRERFSILIRAGTPRMDAYAQIGGEFYLSEDSIRKIVASG